MATEPVNASADALLDALPQTQCTRCGLPDCAGYAQAIAAGEADINQCPPGGAEGVARLARLTGLPVRPIDPRFGVEGPRALAVIDEAWCIGCTLCLDACPTDAIVGIHKRMHTVIDQHCTGCELCIPVCPVDCISLDVVTEGRSGWAAWSQTQASEARARYAVHARRLGAAAQRATTKGEAPPADASQDGATASEKPDPEAQKRLIVATALARARAKLKP